MLIKERNNKTIKTIVRALGLLLGFLGLLFTVTYLAIAIGTDNLFAFSDNIGLFYAGIVCNMLGYLAFLVDIIWL